MNFRRFSLAIASFAATVPLATAQVVISEIGITDKGAPDQYIELTNLGQGDVDLGDWSLYYATLTGGQVNNYWWAFPDGTIISPNTYLRIHWLQPIQAPTATDIYTGTSVLNFLFGYKPEPLLRDQGALALLSSQENSAMNSAGIFREWVSWGGSGFARENLAVQNQRWQANTWVPAPMVGDNIALIYGRQAEPTLVSAYFPDATPTPLEHNHLNANLVSYGTRCGVGTTPAPQLQTVSIPANGNRDFALNVLNTSVGQNLVFLMSATQGTGSPQLGPCKAWVGLPVVNIAFPATAEMTNIPINMLDPNLRGGTVYVQAITLRSATDYGFTEGLGISLGA